MSGYWNGVPRGNWVISDITDAIQVLTDPESRSTLDKEKNRILVFGPEKKSVLIDLEVIFSFITIEDRIDFLHKLEELTGETFNLV